MISKDKKVETAMPKVDIKEKSVVNVVIDDNVLNIKLKEYHSIAYLEKLKETTYKGKKVVFILPNGKEYH